VIWGFILKILGPILVVGALILWGYSLGSAAMQRKWDKATAEDREKEEELYRIRNSANAKVTGKTYEELQKLAVSAAAAHSESERLRELLADRIENSKPEPGVNETRPLAIALSECSGEYEKVAKTADELAVRVTGLQGYVREVCLRGVQDSDLLAPE